MEPTLLYGHPAGTSMGLVAALEWMGRPYRLCRVDMLGEMRDPSYARVNHRHETPVMITGEGRPLTETMAIGLHLAARDEDRRVSFDPLSPDADRMHQLMGFLNTGFTHAFAPLWVAMEMQKPDPEYQAALRRLGTDLVLDRHDKLEAMVGDGPWLVGGRRSLADALLAGVGRWLEIHQVAEVARWPRLAFIRARIEADDAVRYATELESGGTPAGTGACVGHTPLAAVIERYGS
jgi:glutathione S-transferase